MVGLLFIIMSLSSIFFSSCDGTGCCGGSSHQDTVPWIVLMAQNGGQSCIGAVIGHEDGTARVLIPNQCTDRIDHKAAQFVHFEELQHPITLHGLQAVASMDASLATVTYTMPDNIRNTPTLLPDQKSESKDKGKWWRKGSTFYPNYQTGKWEKIEVSVIDDAECVRITEGRAEGLAANQFFCVLFPNSNSPFLPGTPYFTSKRNSNTLWGVDAGRESTIYPGKGETRIFYRVQYYVDTYGLSA